MSSKQAPTGGVQLLASASAPHGASGWPWPKSWDRVPDPKTKAEAVELVESCAGRLDAMISAVTKALSKGSRHRGKSLSRSILVSDTARIAAIGLACKHKGLDWQADKIVSEGKALNLFEHSNEWHRLLFVGDNGEKMRPAFDSGVREYAKQHLALRVGRPLSRLSPRQFLLQGGMPALATWLAGNLPTAKFAITTDVPNCFLSLNRERVEADMPLPRAVTREVLFEPFKRVKMGFPAYGMGTNSLFPISSVLYECGAVEGRGTPPGSALASLAAELSLRHVLDAVEASAEGVLSASYSDNIVILTSSADAAEASIEALRTAAFEEFQHDVAKQLCTRIERRKPNEGVKFCGSNYVYRKGKVRRTLTENRLARFGVWLSNAKFEQKLTDDQVRKRIEGWVAANNFDPRVPIEAAKLMVEFGLTN